MLALGVITLTIAKVFIVDTASISGICRALSVIGLGVVLLGIGFLYQRLLFPRAPAAGPIASSEKCRVGRLTAAGNSIRPLNHKPRRVTLVPPDTYIERGNTCFDSLICLVP